MVGFLGPTELILIIVLVAIFFFGKDKVLDWIRSVRAVKSELSESTKETKKVKKKK
jgi:Sec-independent protein translocase protein TatA